MAAFGTFTLFLALAASLWAAGAAAVAHRRGQLALLRSAEGAMRGALLALTLGSFALVQLFLARDFSVRYVAEYSDSHLSTAYTIAAFWAGQNGSLLLWAWMLAGTAVLAARIHRHRDPDLQAVLVVVLALTLAMFTALVALTSNPFAPLGFTPDDGAGLNPMLHNWGQLYHPPATFLGYVGFTVPFALAIAALVTGQLDVRWVRAMRPWLIASWVLLGLGILLGARWAYTELGWGGYWAWDPVENVSLLPWLTATAALHGAVLQERRGTAQVWNLSMVIASFALTIFGTFLVRSGVASSVHAFAESSAGMYLLAGIGAVLVAGTGLIVWRLPVLRRAAEPTSPLSRERLLVLTNALLLAYTLAIFWGTLFPVILRVVQGRDVIVGEPFFDLLSLPFGVVLVALVGICPVAAWRRAGSGHLRRALAVPLIAALGVGVLAAVLDGGAHPMTVVMLTLSTLAITTALLEIHRSVTAHGLPDPVTGTRRLGRLVGRNPRRFGATVAHLGILLLIVGVSLDVTYRSDSFHTLTLGEQVEVGGYLLSLDGLDTVMEDTRMALVATVGVTRASGRDAGSLQTERYLRVNQDQPRTAVGVRSLVREDIYVILGDVDTDAGTAELHVHLHPGVLWIWVGGVLLLLGGLIAMLPTRHRPPVDEEPEPPVPPVAVAATGKDNEEAGR